MNREELAGLLRHAVDCYGADLPVPVPLVPEPVAPESPPVPEHQSPSETPPVPETPAVRESPLVPQAVNDPTESLEALKVEVLPCTKCKLAKTRTQVVFGEGNPRARVFFIGEAPGANEDRTGRPFVGRAGQLLDRIISNAMGLRREEVFIGNVNKCRPPGNRAPAPDEVAACLPYLKQQVAIIRPEVIVTLGRVAVGNLLGTSLPMGKLRGMTLDYQGTPVVATWHPAYLLRNPSAKAGTWEDIKRVNLLLGLPEIPQEPGESPPQRQ